MKLKFVSEISGEVSISVYLFFLLALFPVTHLYASDTIGICKVRLPVLDLEKIEPAPIHPPRGFLLINPFLFEPQRFADSVTMEKETKHYDELRWNTSYDPEDEKPRMTLKEAIEEDSKCADLAKKVRTRLSCTQTSKDTRKYSYGPHRVIVGGLKKRVVLTNMSLVLSLSLAFLACSSRRP